MRFLFLAGLLLGGLALEGGPLSGRRAPGFALPDSRLQHYDLQDYRGKWVLLDLMSTECGNCAVFAGVLEQAKARYGARLVILSVVTYPPDNQETVARFISQNKVSTPVLFDCGQMSRSYLKVTPKDPSRPLPHIFLIDPNGMIVEDYGHTPVTKQIFTAKGLFGVLDRLVK